jgi:TRAP-type mannitol/chloroaromatic compound transport system permease small subunit
MAIMTFDDDKEELIEYLDTIFLLFFTFILVYFFYKNSVHYFSFLEASASEGKAVSYIGQAGKDTINSVSLFLRFYLLAIRVYIYDF